MSEEKTSRIEILDSFRALAALGVLWIHIWSIHQQPSIIVKGINIITPINIVGNGVDLFFVISGFCMYYFYAKDSTFSINNFGGFLIKRWKRLSPVFYFSTVVYILIFSNSSWIVNSLKFLTSVFYLNSLSSYNAEGFMWSLGTEWQFYLVIPFFLIYQHKIGFNKTTLIITAFFLTVSVTSVLFLKDKSNILTAQIIFRYFEFLWGIIIGRLFLLDFKLKINANILILLFLLLAYFGRFFLTETVLSKGQEYRNLIKIIGYNIMSIGFAGLIYVCLKTKNILASLINNKLFSFIGRISYSFYLWHGLVHVIIGRLLTTNEMTSDFDNIHLVIINFIISTILLIPISYISFLKLKLIMFY
jgi:peptidoglycan/LPS O-acetylase OafA/YrhL